MARTGDCTVSCNPTEPFWSEDAVDSAYVASHSATLLVGNQIVPWVDSEVLRTTTSRIQLYEAAVRVSYMDGSPVNEGYIVPIVGLVDRSRSSDVGYNCTDVLLLDGATMDILRREAAALGREVEVLATIVIRGRTLGGQEVEAAEWSYPVRVCFGCSPCVDTLPIGCCYGGPHQDCEDLEDVELSCSGVRGPQDCRSLGRTCAEHLAAATP
ncbi:hypothetical protein [Sorangium sp. So ce1097]|uniref:hypothetical protein n=1 Tax=Sorangium sp. So ce1097 TaxID=3133330 RepID=UPI003F5EE3ED